jgi:hypothetical protein
MIHHSYQIYVGKSRRSMQKKGKISLPHLTKLRFFSITQACACTFKIFVQRFHPIHYNNY